MSRRPVDLATVEEVRLALGESEAKPIELLGRIVRRRRRDGALELLDRARHLFQLAERVERGEALSLTDAALLAENRRAAYRVDGGRRTLGGVYFLLDKIAYAPIRAARIAEARAARAAKQERRLAQQRVEAEAKVRRAAREAAEKEAAERAKREAAVAAAKAKAARPAPSSRKSEPRLPIVEYRRR